MRKRHYPLGRWGKNALWSANSHTTQSKCAGYCLKFVFWLLMLLLLAMFHLVPTMWASPLLLFLLVKMHRGGCWAFELEERRGTDLASSGWACCVGLNKPNTHRARLWLLHQFLVPTYTIDGTQLRLLSAVCFLSDTTLSQCVTAALIRLHGLLLQLSIDWKILLLYLVTRLSINRSQVALWLASRSWKTQEQWGIWENSKKPRLLKQSV